MKKDLPVVSVVCVCYNHEKFVRQAILSVVHQSYPNVEVIIVDDHSTDRSVDIIKNLIKDHVNVRLIEMPQNTGNCKAFNEGWKASSGEFLIDFACDDVLDVECVDNAMEAFKGRDPSFGVLYGDAVHTSSNGRHLFRQSEKYWNGHPPQGDVYKELIKRYFICSAAMVVRRSVFEKLGGYDESLAYEDFDFWIRSAREFKYFNTPSILVYKRVVKGSMSSRQFRRGDPQQLSTYRICEKILLLNKNAEEDQALRRRVRYEIRHALFRFDLSLMKLYRGLLSKINTGSRAAYK